jgi:hypothetical protein
MRTPCGQIFHSAGARAINAHATCRMRRSKLQFVQRGIITVTVPHLSMLHHAMPSDWQAKQPRKHRAPFRRHVAKRARQELPPSCAYWWARPGYAVHMRVCMPQHDDTHQRQPSRQCQQACERDRTRLNVASRHAERTMRPRHPPARTTKSKFRRVPPRRWMASAA